MSLSQRKITDAQINSNGVVSAPDILTGTANENKQVFDKLIKDIVKVSVNNVIDDLLATTAAAEIGANITGMSGTNVAAVLTELKNTVDDKVAISATTYTESQKTQIRENIGVSGSQVAVTSVNGHTGAVTVVETVNGSKGDVITYNADCEYRVCRWLRFSPSNRKALVIKAGTSIKKLNGEYQHYLVDTTIDLTSYISSNGANYFVYLANDGTISASTDGTLTTGVKIGRFHTLCVNAGTMNMILPPSGSAVGDYVMVKGYREDEDSDFYNFYRKQVSASTNLKETVPHPLSGFQAGDILPESVFCLTWKPNALFDDAMVYDKDTDRVIDVYLQSGIGLNTRSAYNATHTVSRQQANHMSDMRMVGKTLLSDAEFESAAIGSNETTNIEGNSDKTVVGGHSDTAGRRMISAIGCEEMCGYLDQWTRDVASTGASGWSTTDGNGSFGQEYGTPYVLLAGGGWSFSAGCGSRLRVSSDLRSYVHASIGGRGVSHIVRWL